jgi:DNA-binding MarR family transcriptional regulator
MLAHEHYRKLLLFRVGLRRFLRWSDGQATSLGLSPSQHQLLLTIAGHDDARGPTIGDVADYLLLRHHSAVGLVDRAEAAGLVRRKPDPEDHRVVRLGLTALGRRRLERLSALHLDQLKQLTPSITQLWDDLE